MATSDRSGPRVLLGAALVLALAACAPMPPATPDRPSSAPSVTSSALVLVDVDGSGMGLRGRLVDPRTLSDVAGKPVLSFGHNYTAVTAPDGRTLAAVLWPGGSANRGGVLHLFDLASWTDRATAVTFDDHVSQLFFAPDGRHLYWVRPGPMAGEPMLNPDPGVYRYDLASDSQSRVAELPAAFLPLSAALAGERLAIVGWTTGGKIGPSRNTEVYVVDLRGGTVVKRELGGVRAGQVQDLAAFDDVRNVMPAVAWDLPRGRAFVVDAEQDRVAIVDLASATVRGPTAIRPRRSLVDRILDLISTPAAAKAQASTQRVAVVSADGRRLYVSGLRIDLPSADREGNVTPLDLLAVDTMDLAEIGRMDVAGTDLALTHDGQRLLILTNRFPTGQPWTDYELRLIDAQRLTSLASLPLEGRGRILGLSADGDVVYVNAMRDDWALTIVRRVSVADLTVLGRRELERHFGELLGSP
ncbi:MAG: hypothetical protein E6I40_01390 [Chloroflexi bacterium]|nr:MAG: hypothetical protein E6I40_01390 [Chloroflexota bacterium]